MEKRVRLFPGSSPVLAVLAAVVIALVVINGCLYESNRNYREQNRSLIIQNDPVLSITIELNERLNHYKHAVFKDRSRQGIKLL